MLELCLGGGLAKDLAGLQEANQAVAKSHGHRRVAKAGRAANGVRFQSGAGCQFLLHLQTGGAGAAGFEDQGAKGALVALAMVGKLPRFHRPQSDRKSRSLSEGALVVLEDLGVAQALDQAPVSVGAAAAPGFERRQLCSGRPAAGPPGRGGARVLAALRGLPNKGCLHGGRLPEAALRLNWDQAFLLPEANCGTRAGPIHGPNIVGDDVRSLILLRQRGDQRLLTSSPTAVSCFPTPRASAKLAPDELIEFLLCQFTNMPARSAG